MRFAIALLSCLLLSGLLYAQTSSCPVCPSPESGPRPQSHVVCLSAKELIAHIFTRKPVGPPGLNEPHMNSHGIVAACLCFEPTGKVEQVNILSGPAMMQQSVLESVRPAKAGMISGCKSHRGKSPNPVA